MLYNNNHNKRLNNTKLYIIVITTDFLIIIIITVTLTRIKNNNNYHFSYLLVTVYQPINNNNTFYLYGNRVPIWSKDYGGTDQEQFNSLRGIESLVTTTLQKPRNVDKVVLFAPETLTLLQSKVGLNPSFQRILNSKHRSRSGIRRKDRNILIDLRNVGSEIIASETAKQAFRKQYCMTQIKEFCAKGLSIETIADCISDLISKSELDRETICRLALMFFMDASWCSFADVEIIGKCTLI